MMHMASMWVGLLLIVSALADSTAATESAALSQKIESMRIKEPLPVLITLDSLGLDEAIDFAILQDAERDEMMAVLEKSGVCLGDRAKLRHHFGMLIADGGAPDERRVEMVAPESTANSWYRLQESPSSSGGVSGDTGVV
jgi:hypothetical protein